MVTTLRVVLTEIQLDPESEQAQYALEVTRALIRRAPDGCAVEGIVASTPRAERDGIRALFPSISGLHRLPLSLAAVQATWGIGITRSTGGGMLHAPSTFAPIRRHDRLHGDIRQLSVTVSSTRALASTSTTTPRDRSMKRATKRALRLADAIVVPTHAVAAELVAMFGANDRIRVIGNGVSGAVAQALSGTGPEEHTLPSEYVLLPGHHLDRAWLTAAVGALLTRISNDIAVIVPGLEPASADHLRADLDSSGVDGATLITPGPMTANERAAAIHGAAVVIDADRSDGAGQLIIDTLAFGTPLVHVSTPALDEVAAGAGVSVHVDNDDAAELLADEVVRVLGDTTLRQRLRLIGRDRSIAFGWNDTADKIWQLHADL